MPIRFTCSCGKALTVPDSYAGREGRCKACGAVQLVPVPAGSAAAVLDLDGKSYTLGASSGGVTAAGITRGIANGTFSGFTRRDPRTGKPVPRKPR